MHIVRFFGIIIAVKKMKLRVLTYIMSLFVFFGVLSACDKSAQDEPSSVTQIVSQENTTQSTVSVSSDTVSSMNSSNDGAASQLPPRLEVTGEFRGVWMSYYEVSDLCKGKSEAQFRTKVSEYFTNIAQAGLTAVIAHVRPSSDAFYRSAIFPWSLYASGTQGKDPGYDPLAIMVEIAHANGLELHAWLNPYRVCTVKNFEILADSIPAKIWLTDADTQNDRRVREAGGGYYYNPALPAVRELIIDGVREIVQNYAVDAIHFDDYFYPTTAKSFDDLEYQDYCAQTGVTALSLGDWRREQVNTLMRGVYAAVKAIDPQVKFGISPGGRVEYNRDTLYADCALWLSQAGYADYICPQIYFGFEHPTEAVRFTQLSAQWSALSTNPAVQLYLGLASYKIGTEDRDSKEWIENNDILKRQVLLSRQDPVVDGIAFYSYTSLFGSKEYYRAERENVLALFKTTEDS